MYKEFIMQLCMYANMIILAKGYLPITLVTPLKLKEILSMAQMTIRKMNPDYDLVIKRLHLYNDMRLVTFGIAGKKSNNSISSIHTAIHTAGISTVSDRNSSNSYHRPE